MDKQSSVVVFFLAALTFAICSANRDFGNSNGGGGWPFRHRNASQASNRIIVGGSENNWRFGFNYQDWAWKNAPFYINDTLVFKYDLPNGTLGHSVSLLPNYWSFIRCDFRRAKLIGNMTEGAGEGGLEFRLKRGMPHYFACGEHDGIHCKSGMMKFAVFPVFRWGY